MNRFSKPSPAMVVAIISLIVAIGGTAAALPGKFTVGGDDLKKNSVGARSIGRTILDFGLVVGSSDPVEGDGVFTEMEGSIRCPTKAPFAFDPSIGNLGPKAFLIRRSTLANGFGGPGGYRFILSSDEGPDVGYGITVNCLLRR